MLENVQELRAAGREDDYLGKVHREIDSFESETSGSELVSGLITNSSSAVLRLGMATTVLAGASLIAFGEISFMTFFAYLIVITRIYAPFDQSLALVSELFSSHIASERLQSIEREPVTCGKGLSPHKDIASSSRMSPSPMAINLCSMGSRLSLKRGRLRRLLVRRALASQLAPVWRHACGIRKVV